MTQNTETFRGPVDTAPHEISLVVPGGQSAPNLDLLLQELDAPAPPPVPNVSYENHLVEVRLGIASSLFAAIRHKHAPTAAHSLRVALGCSAWGFALGLRPRRSRRVGSRGPAARHRQDRRARSLAAQARTRWRRTKSSLMDQYRLTGLDILANCCHSQAIVDIIRHSARLVRRQPQRTIRWWATRFRSAPGCWRSSTRSTR